MTESERAQWVIKNKLKDHCVPKENPHKLWGRIFRKEDSGMEVSKKDWKLYREKIPEWQEAYMEKLIASYVKYLEGFSDELKETVNYLI